MKLSGLHIFKDYNQASSNQRRVLIKLAEPFIDSLQHIDTNFNETIVISDYGSAEGYNSVAFFNQTLPRFREFSQKPIMIIHNDLPENNWNTTFKTLEDSDSYVKIPNVYFSGLGRTFIQQIFPNNYVHIGISSLAFHFLPQSFSVFDHICPSSTNDLILKQQIAEVAHSHFINILTQRYKELVDLGRLLIIIPTETVGMLYPAVPIQIVNENMYAKGVINEEEKGKITIPTYGKSDEEIQRALEEVKHLYRIIENKKVDDDWKLTEENKEEFLESLKLLAIKHLETCLKRVVKRDEEEVKLIIEEYRKEIEVIVENTPFTRFPTFHLIILEKIPF
ncbi:unnamed protein product [Blepharisma stoltei]|uniref:Uncharacterized protein n=1 Tax=Blepharisma stoltei TaxID=1481888 RepID=A0AAU9IX21_9CILI|nr:unnamed protein product [Blepharisma stoltei]